MNEHQPNWGIEHRSAPRLIRTLEHEKQLFMTMRTNRSPVIILSDFDNTLCDTSSFDPITNDHTPELDPELLERAQELPLVVATGRRANHPWLPTLWTSGMVHPAVPIIAENGGVLMAPRGDTTKNVVLTKTELDQDVLDWAADMAHIPQASNQRLAVKTGLTALILRSQTAAGDSARRDQHKLLKRIDKLGVPDGFEAIHSGTSVTLQPSDVSKGKAFREVLRMLNVARSSVQVLGIGDSANDASIFKEADISVGVHKDVAKLVDFAGSHGVATTKVLLGLAFDTRLFDLAKIATRASDLATGGRS